MDIIVAKGSDFVLNEIETLAATDKEINVQIIFIYPNGLTKVIKTNVELFRTLEMLDSSIIYGDLYPMVGWDEPLDESYKSLE